jgi:hypothetical protein
MAKAKFLCVSKTGTETHTVQLEPVDVDVCPTCGKRTSAKFCKGDAVEHAITAVPDGDRSFFKDLPHANIFLSVLTPEAGAEFEVGQETLVEFTLVKKKK